MQYQVDPTDLSPENGQKPVFLHFGSFKNAFLWLLNDPAWALSQPNCCDHLVLSEYAISSWCDGPNSRKRQISGWIIQNGLPVIGKKTLKYVSDFSRTCGFREEFRKSLNFHSKPSKVMIVRLDFRQNPLKVEKWLFLALYRDYWMIQIFPGKSGRVGFLYLLSFNFWPSFGKIKWREVP